jgi:general secretion pathway protein M
MIAWLEARTRREQVLLALMAALLCAFLLLLLVYRPLAEARLEAERRYAQAAREAVAVQQAMSRIRGLPAAGRSSAATADALNAAAQTADVTLARIDPDPAGGVQVAVKGVAPTRVFPWLAELQRSYGLSPRHLTVIKDEQGSLSVDATFGGAN